MTIVRRPNKLLRHLLLALAALHSALLPLHADEAPTRRASTYKEALAAAGNDGMIIFQYGPGWNQRSMRMLKEFWKSKELEQAVGGAVLLAVPLYQQPITQQQKAEQDRISAGMPRPPGKGARICPSLIFIDKAGRVYARLVGMDDLGDESGQAAIPRIKQTLAHLHSQQSLLSRAAAAAGEEQAKLLAEACDVPIALPSNALEKILHADPEDKLGYARRLSYSAQKFLYKQLNTTSGFISSNFRPDYKTTREECLRVINDKALRPEDRQRAYNLLIGLSHKENIPTNQLKKMIDECGKIDPSSTFGKIAPALVQLWANSKNHASADERRADRAARREQRKESQQDKKRHRDINISN